MSDLLKDKVQLQALDPERISKNLQTIRTAIHSRIIGQNAAIDSVTDALAVQDARLSNPKRPRLVLLAAGPTGVGKSLLAKTLAWAWLGDERACSQINCGSMSKANEHYAAGTLLGSASGYVGSDRTPEGRRANSHKANAHVAGVSVGLAKAVSHNLSRTRQ
jgi:ATP-dependent Clp protease ATP-binding subunit ClpA